MIRTPRAASPHDLLRQAPGGPFTARARGLFAAEFLLLDPNGREFGRLRMRGASGAELRLGERVAKFERSERGYRMIADGEEVLVATPKGKLTGELEVSCGGQTYEARVSFFRNLAVASYGRGGGRAVSVSGSLVGRSYQLLFTPDDGCALPAAIFLLWHIAANRRRTYRLGSLMGRGAM